MKSKLFIATLILSATHAMATIDSYTVVKFPVHAMHEERICMVDSLAHDGISNIGTHQMLVINALNNPFKIPAIHNGEDENGLLDNVNMLYQQGIKLSIDVEYSTVDKATLTIDASEASKNAKSIGERAEIIRNVKLAIYSGVINSIDTIFKTIKIELKGLPDQSDLSSKVPEKFNSNFTKNSPYMQLIQTELNIKDGIRNC
jgi:hypothetical protein